MIKLTRLNGPEFYINPDMILTMEPTPDTIITLTNEEKLLVEESPEEVRRRFIAYKQEITIGGPKALEQRPIEI